MSVSAWGWEREETGKAKQKENYEGEEYGGILESGTFILRFKYRRSIQVGGGVGGSKILPLNRKMVKVTLEKNKTFWMEVIIVAIFGKYYLPPSDSV